ncbi:50S ribosomal protein L9 [Candidatus Vallotia tarda]|uniref:Large ribosomal subunit protein bL9 n=1 Tax=Candidatus Vallotiella hemipterorum TaxID=1177213 RepID=A0A916JWD8_9BURK|nr:50S ribosomal protein L9 [Candidatus Vallotia tarda]CAG7602600.1 50S ribosomal protein L9 [Candidatus Vallotia tarda]
MQIILLEKIVKLGNLGDIVKVKDGYARNFLIPCRKARHATKDAISEFEVKRAQLEKIAAGKLIAAQEQSDKLKSLTLQVVQKSGVDGRLFGSVTNQDISTELKRQGFSIEKAQVRLSKGPIKTIGDHLLQIVLHTDVVTDITVSVLSAQE